MPRPGFAFQRTQKKVFFIGFNKTATSSLALLMMASGVLSLHSSGNGKLFGRTAGERAVIPHATKHMLANLEAGRDPIDGLDSYDAFLDLTVGPIDLCRQFREVFETHPTAVFVLNTRPLDDWIASRIAHRRSVADAARHFQLTADQVIEKWRADYRDHHADARAFFEAAAPAQFLEWDIRTAPVHLADFLRSHGIVVDPAYYFHVRETGGLYFPQPLRAVARPASVPIHAR